MPLNPPPTQNEVVRDVNRRMLLTQVWQLWFDNIRVLIEPINADGSITPPSLSDTDASNNTIYYSTTQSKLVYKDAGGTVNALY